MDFSNEKIVGKIIEIPNDDILPNRFQPRKYFDEAETLELAESIKEHGILQPIVVRKVGDKYEIIAGERRFKANILAGNDTITAIVSNLNDKDSSEIAVIENIQRQNLTPIEEAVSYKRIIDMGYTTQEELAKRVGKSQSAIANKIRLLKLSDNVQDALMEKKISERHARSLLQLNDLKKQDELLTRIINERLTVRKTDEEIKKMNNEMNNQQIPNYNQPTNITMDQPMSAPTPSVDAMVQQPTFENQMPNIEQSVSPIMGTPVSAFEQPVQQAPVQDTMVETNANDFVATPAVETPIPENNSAFSQPVDIQPSIFNQPIETPQPAVTNDQLINNTNYTQSVETTNQPSATDIPLSSTPVSDFTNNSFLDTAPITTESNDSPSDGINQFTMNQPTFEQPITPQPTMDIPNTIETPSFQPEQPIDTNVGMNTPVVDLNQPIAQTQINDIPITNNATASVTPDPIIVTNDDKEFDPIMPEQPSTEPTLDFKTIINLIRQCSETIEKCGYKIDTEEYDLEGKYQVTFTIEK